MDSLQSKLIGALVGLARATDGNPHLITAEVTAVVRECLKASPSGEEALQYFLRRVEEAKKHMVPDCFLCANPCGRTSAYDLSRIDQAEPDIRNVKFRILRELQESAEGELEKPQENLLYRGLIAIGMEDCSAEELYSLFRTTQV